MDQLFARRRDERVRNAQARLAKRRSLKDKVGELTALTTARTRSARPAPPDANLMRSSRLD